MPLKTAPVESFELGQIVGVHGVRGAVKLRLHHADCRSLFAGVEITLVADTQATRSLRVNRVAEKPGTKFCRLWLEGIDSLEAAEALRSATVFVQRSDLPQLAEDEFYLADLVGVRVCHKGSPEVELGEVVGIVDNPGQDLCEIEFVDGERTRTWLLPVVAAYIDGLDTQLGKMTVDLPQGLLPAALERALTGPSNADAGE